MERLEKLTMERNLHVCYYYNKKKNTYVIESTLNDYAHDVTAVLEADMEKGIVVDCRFDIKTVPQARCYCAQALCEDIIGIELNKDFTETIMKKLLNKDGCENLMELLTLGGAAIQFVYFRHLIDLGQLTWPEYGKKLFENRLNTCLAFNPAAVPPVDDWKDFEEKA